MTRTGLVMAGGRGKRMARSGVSARKPLVTVAGATLLEWNVRLLVHSGVDRIVVSVAADDVLVREAVAHLWAVGDRAGVPVDELPEHRALDNIGPVGLLHGSVDDVVVVYADNLTGIDLRAIYDHHRDSGADLTLAAHREPFDMPFGELATAPADAGRLLRYIEKPTYRPLVASGVMVLGRRAIERAALAAPIAIARLSQELVDAGAEVRLWHHDAPWVDVNDRAAVERAELLVAEHPEVFGRVGLFEELDPVASEVGS